MAELVVKWPRRSGATRYRVYMGDEHRLAAAIHVTLMKNAARAVHAGIIQSKASMIDNKADFTFLGETSAKPDPEDGKIHYQTQIPGSLRGLQFLRIVPLSAGGAEPPFDTCGLRPIAVPRVDAPPPPGLTVTSDPVEGTTLAIQARGLRSDLVAAGGGNPPVYRIRRNS